ncbi:hypothetical protein JAAARDRAFT_73929 [Jaapia argillacea MUCL 33604]|uniref:Uncharacterized protein n=1 Tax=Jaapia argillacea MUCL 33604 TaxID=933084 RepID=A0A067PB00_9AGAM|nr:hypothetical protein JAAARDRAFT_73929 [Jaapia argillacea MUCL 33604]
MVHSPARHTNGHGHGLASEDDLQGYFDRYAGAVRHNFSRFESQLGRPAFEVFQQSFNERPVITTFLAIYAVLSVVPVLSFIGFSLFLTTTYTFLAFGGAFVVSVVSILFLGSILIPTLLLTLLFTALITSFLLSAFLAWRFWVLVRKEGPRGVGEWGGETKRRFARHHRREEVPAAARDAKEKVETEQQDVGRPDPVTHHENGIKGEGEGGGDSDTSSAVVIPSNRTSAYMPSSGTIFIPANEENRGRSVERKEGGTMETFYQVEAGSGDGGDGEYVGQEGKQEGGI